MCTSIIYYKYLLNSSLVQILAPELSGSDITRLFSIIDIDKNSQISYTEFLAATLDPREVYSLCSTVMVCLILTLVVWLSGGY